MSTDVITGGEGEPAEPAITDYDYITSALGHGFFSGVPFDKLWNCIRLSETREELEAAVVATVKLHEMTHGKSGCAAKTAPSEGGASRHSRWQSTLDALRRFTDRLHFDGKRRR